MTNVKIDPNAEPVSANATFRLVPVESPRALSK